MQRSIPFYTQRIVPEAVNKGKRVLVTSHENAIRGILMYLCDIPEDAMNQLHLPNGVPLVYNVKRKCITLLDDGSGVDPMEKYDFGPAAQYLFRPCELGDDFFDKVSSYIRVFIVIRKNAALTCDIDGATGQSESSRKTHNLW